MKAPTPAESRFWAMVNRREEDECWPWMGYIHPSGYGSFRFDGRLTTAHRVAYTLSRGALAAVLTVDHLCRNRRCVNPRHLEAVTPRENVLRGIGLTAQNARKSQCKRGHAFDPDNTVPLTMPNGRIGRGCRACRNEAKRRLRLRQRAAA